MLLLSSNVGVFFLLRKVSERNGGEYLPPQQRWELTESLKSSKTASLFVSSSAAAQVRYVSDILPSHSSLRLQVCFPTAGPFFIQYHGLVSLFLTRRR